MDEAEAAGAAPPGSCVLLPERPGNGRGSPGHLVLTTPVSGVVGGTRRTAHVFVAVTGASRCLTALCGLRARLDSVDLLEEPPGARCRRCLTAAANRRQCPPSNDA